jgi:hypothetical protein
MRDREREEHRRPVVSHSPLLRACPRLPNSPNSPTDLNWLGFKGAGQEREAHVRPQFEFVRRALLTVQRSLHLPASHPQPDHTPWATSTTTLSDLDLSTVHTTAPSTRSKGKRRADTWCRRSSAWHSEKENETQIVPLNNSHPCFCMTCMTHVCTMYPCVPASMNVNVLSLSLLSPQPVGPLPRPVAEVFHRVEAVCSCWQCRG